MIDIRQEHLLPVPFRIFGFFLLVLGTGITGAFLVRLITQGDLAWELPGGILTGLTGALLAMSHYRLMIDSHNKAFKVATWVLGFRRGEWEKFNYVERIFVNRVVQSTTISSFTGHPHEVKEYLFKAFMKTDTGEKIHLDSDKTEHRLQVRLEEYRKSLGDLYRGE